MARSREDKTQAAARRVRRELTANYRTEIRNGMIAVVGTARDELAQAFDVLPIPVMRPDKARELAAALLLAAEEAER